MLGNVPQTPSHPGVKIADSREVYAASEAEGNSVVAWVYHYVQDSLTYEMQNGTWTDACNLDDIDTVKGSVGIEPEGKK